MNLKEFREATKDFPENTEILIDNSSHYRINYVKLIKNSVPTEMLTNPKAKVFNDQLEFNTYK